MNVNNHGVPFMSVPEAARETGLSQHYLREGSKRGDIPHIMSGRKILINIPALLRVLGATDTATIEADGQEGKK